MSNHYGYLAPIPRELPMTSRFEINAKIATQRAIDIWGSTGEAIAAPYERARDHLSAVHAWVLVGNLTKARRHAKAARLMESRATKFNIGPVREYAWQAESAARELEARIEASNLQAAE